VIFLKIAIDLLLSRPFGYENPKRKLGVTTHFSEIIEIKLGKKMPYILCILKLFEKLGC